MSHTDGTDETERTDDYRDDVGLAGMANYFLRPVYHFIFRLGRYATRVAG